MRTFRTLTLIAITLLGFTSCSNDDDVTQLLAVELETISNLHAPQTGGQGQPIGGEFTKFDFSTGTTTTSETDWDIAFRGSTILVNGGASQGTSDEPARTGNAAAYITSNTFAGVISVDESLFVQDSQSALAIPTGSDNSWYNYNSATFTISPLAGKILVFRTADDKYAKVEILSYYENAPATPDPFTDASRYFTFNYVYQPNDGVTTFE
jgi:hypothetical protein